MKIFLTHSDIVIGEVLVTFGSKHTQEIKGILIPNEQYSKVRAGIIKYNELKNTEHKDLLDRFLSNMLEKKYKNLIDWYSDFKIIADDKVLTNPDSNLRIYDTLNKTGLGNLIVEIEAWNLKSLKEEFKIHTIEYLYPSEPKNVIEIKTNGKLVMTY